MAASRTHGWLLEQPARAVRLALIAALVVASAAAIALFLPTPREQKPGHAYAIPSPTRRIVVEVLNGTSRPGFARAATRSLRRRGLDVVFFGTADTRVEATRILVRRGDPGRGRDVRDALGVGRVVVQPDTTRRVDVSVILGSDFRPQDELHP